MPERKLSKAKLSPIGAERLFVANVFILSIALAANFVLLTNVLRAQRLELIHKKTDLDILRENTASIKTIGQYLKDSQSAIDKTSLTMANIGFSGDYSNRSKSGPPTSSSTFQEQFIYDVGNYAKQVGIGIAGYTFPGIDQQGTSATGAKTSAPSQAQSTPATGASGTTGASGASAAGGVSSLKIPSGVEATNITIVFSNDGKIPYSSFLKFLKLLEQNTTRMYISKIELAPDSDGTSVTQANMEITIFSRKSS